MKADPGARPDTAAAQQPSITRHEQHSLFGEILDWMLAPLMLLWPMSIFLTYLVAQNIADKPFDRELALLLRSIARQVSVQAATAPGGEGQRLTMPQAVTDFLRADDSDHVYFQVLGVRGELVAGDAGLPVPLNDTLAPGEVYFRNETMRGEEVRVAYLWVALPGPIEPGYALAQLAETLGKRSVLANEIIKGVILPQFMILPLAVVLVWFALSHGIKPLDRLQQRIRQRASSDLSPIDELDVPDEVAPLVRAINELLARLDQSIATQKHFLADAAHQLKTPLAGMRMQAELAVRDIESGSTDIASLKLSLHQMALSSQRAAHAVNQLLALARAEGRKQAWHEQPLDLADIALQTVRDFVPQALAKRIDLGFESPSEGPALPLTGQPVLVREMVRNLVDNALIYTPPGGAVTVRVLIDRFGQVMVLQVEDTGPGIAEDERELVFQPFYRTLGTGVDGSGLGLAIVREVAQQHAAKVSIGTARARADDADQAPGTLVTVRLPVRRKPVAQAA
ncbi:MAG: sensor histidine kinase N-terminal domain-containing protein [Rubrivivax sp.]